MDFFYLGLALFVGWCLGFVSFYLLDYRGDEA